MNARVARLREQSLATVPSISAERALLVTEAQERFGALSPPMRRAMTFAHLMERKTIVIGDGELIVGERGPGPKATPTFPELCCHTLRDLDVLHSREKIAYRVCPDVQAAYRDRIIPFWEGRSMRDALFAQMTPEWRAAYDAGVFTEFMEQRAPGHTVLDGRIYRRGMRQVVEEIDRALAALDYVRDPRAYDRQEELRAMRACAAAIVTFAARHAEAALALAAVEPDAGRRHEDHCDWRYFSIRKPEIVPGAL